MMPAMRLRSVRQKLLLMVLVANLCTLFIAGSALLYFDLEETRETSAAQLTVMANLLGKGSVTALEFNDSKVANENLAQLSAAPEVVAAQIYTATGRVFATYLRDPGRAPALPVKPGPEGFRFNGSELSVFMPIAKANETVGTVYLQQRYHFMYWLRRYLTILGAVLLASLAIGLLVSTRLQRWVSGPIVAVRDVARQVMEQRNFALRAPHTTVDEIGQLAEAFNGMLHALEHEIAERSAAEQAVRTLNTDLEARVHERTTELQAANQSLLTRTDEAENANRAKADFLANMSHEIRTPMNGILGLAYLLERQQLDNAALDLVRKIRNAGRSLQAIINDILDFSKIEAGYLEIEHAPFRLADIFENLAAIMAANAGDKAIELVIAPVPAVGGHLLGDALRIEQILINLTGNAIKFTEQGEIVLGIGVVSQDATTVTIRFSVKDSGLGIPFDKQAHIFSAFSQADASTTRRFGGTGLGLTICRHLVQKMGGEIGVISAPGAGSEFWFNIPFAWDGQADYAPAELAKLDVLIADDSALACENLALSARSIGWTATSTESGEAAIERVLAKRANKGSYDVLLIDWKMPGMDGLEVASRLHGQFKGDTPPIVLMVTAFAQDALRAHPDIEFVDDILSKPVTSSMLYNSVASALQKRGRGGLALRGPATRTGKRLPGVRALVVDDSPINREVAMRILCDEGASVELANDGLAALHWLQANPTAVDIVLMDVQMPEMDGYEATRQLRASPATAKLPIIALTAGAFRVQQEEARAAGMDAFVAKPFNVDVLIETIQNLTHCQALAVDESDAATPDTNPKLPLLPVLPGIAIAAGLKVWKQMESYRKFLLKFRDEHGDFLRELAGHFSAGDDVAAKALTHKVKGVAANLALVDVALCAADLETALRTGNDPAQVLVRLDSAMATVLQSIDTLADVSVAAAAEPIPPPHGGAMPDLVRDLLRALDTDSPRQANAVLDAIGSALAADVSARIRHCVDNFDFRAAEVLVRELVPEHVNLK